MRTGSANPRDRETPAHHSALRGLRPVVVGVVHGLANSAALTLLLLTKIEMGGGSRVLGLMYLLVSAQGLSEGCC